MKKIEKDVNKTPKPVQEGKPSSKQRPLGDKDDLERNEKYKKGDDAKDVNSVGIAKKRECNLNCVIHPACAAPAGAAHAG